ncbi:MAG: hypothetical protein ACF8PN_12245 [Phycisphaerales bacterium]
MTSTPSRTRTVRPAGLPAATLVALAALAVALSAGDTATQGWPSRSLARETLGVEQPLRIWSVRVVRAAQRLVGAQAVAALNPAPTDVTIRDQSGLDPDREALDRPIEAPVLLGHLNLPPPLAG